jgi:hypothetical protein
MWCLRLQYELLLCPWPETLLSHPSAREEWWTDESAPSSTLGTGIGEGGAGGSGGAGKGGGNGGGGGMGVGLPLDPDAVSPSSSAPSFTSPARHASVLTRLKGALGSGGIGGGMPPLERPIAAPGDSLSGGQDPSSPDSVAAAAATAAAAAGLSSSPSLSTGAGAGELTTAGAAAAASPLVPGGPSSRHYSSRFGLVFAPQLDGVYSKDAGGAAQGRSRTLIFRGLRARMGLYEGVPTRIRPHLATGRADIYGTLVSTLYDSFI